MWTRIVGASLVLACAAGCTTSFDTPATAPTLGRSTSTSLLPSSVPSTTATPTTTTTPDRIGEIQSIFEDLEHRRLRAILDQDEEAYRSVFANEYYEEASMVVFDEVTVLDPGAARVTIIEVLVDSETCLAAVVESDQSGVNATGGVSIEDWVLEVSERGEWGFSWAGKGWRCVGSHPLS